MQQSSAPVAAAPSAPAHAPESSEMPAEAPPKQVALVMDRLAHAARLIADIRLGADRLLEALFTAADLPHQSEKPFHLILKEESSMRQHLQDLRTVGRQLEASGVLNGSMRSRGNSWGLHMPLICPDGAVVAYAWKRQLAGQAGASAVDRTRLALKAFTDQKKRFFPHLDDDLTSSSGDIPVAKRHCGSQPSILSLREDPIEARTLSDVLKQLEKEAPNVKVFTYQRLDWLKRAVSLSPSSSTSCVDPSKDGSNKSRNGSFGAVSTDQIAVIELFIPSVFRVIVSLHPAGSINSDAVAFFSPDEGGNYVHARGISVYHVFKQITEHADKALQYFLGAKSDVSLCLLLHWICCYQTLFTKVCSNCGHLLMIDKRSALLLPPVHRLYWQTKDQNSDVTPAFHIGCSPDDA
ncbi:mediator of RNA polymerase II transcription subunit 27 isoform X1 [Aristolochia californica]|uniref:mediator of RNA polymerase II transcription subunit 27 isoform X1 n=1 Tax=Aristolochia californica TaxID=171875 RepID=UPI0035DD7790